MQAIRFPPFHKDGERMGHPMDTSTVSKLRKVENGVLKKVVDGVTKVILCSQRGKRLVFSTEDKECTKSYPLRFLVGVHRSAQADTAEAAGPAGSLGFAPMIRSHNMNKTSTACRGFIHRETSASYWGRTNDVKLLAK